MSELSSPQDRYSPLDISQKLNKPEFASSLVQLDTIRSIQAAAERLIPSVSFEHIKNIAYEDIFDDELGIDSVVIIQSGEGITRVYDIDMHLVPEDDTTSSHIESYRIGRFGTLQKISVCVEFDQRELDVITREIKAIKLLEDCLFKADLAGTVKSESEVSKIRNAESHTNVDEQTLSEAHEHVNTQYFEKVEERSAAFMNQLGSFGLSYDRRDPLGMDGSPVEWSNNQHIAFDVYISSLLYYLHTRRERIAMLDEKSEVVDGLLYTKKLNNAHTFDVSEQEARRILAVLVEVESQDSL